MKTQVTNLCLIIYIVAAVIRSLNGQGEQCTNSSIIGDPGGQFLVNRDVRFYLSTDSRETADCSGTVTAITYCYYAPTGHGSGRIYRTNFGVYRPSTEGGSTVYNLVSRVLTIDRSQSQVDSELEYDDKRRRRYISHYDGGRYKRNDDYENNDICNTFSLSEPVVVNPGDVLGACVFDPPDSNIYPLHMVRSDSSSYVLLRADPVTSGCTDTAIPSSISEGSLSDRTSRTLHLYATIVPLPPTDPPTTQPATTATAPTSQAPTTAASTTEEPTTAAPTTQAPITAAPTAQEFTTAAPMTQPPTTFNTTFTTQALTTGALASTMVVVLILIVSSILIIVVIAVLRRSGKNLVNHHRSSVPTASGFDNMLYPMSVFSDGKQNGAKFDHEFYKSQDQDIEHMYVYELPGSAYGYAEMGPSYEAHEHDYETPQAAARSPLDANLLAKNKKGDIYEGINPYQVPASRQGELFGQLKSWGARTIPRSEFQVVGHLGSGQFGSVEQGVWKRQGTGPVDVALKSLTKTSGEDKVKFLQEAVIMAQFNHTNVIKLYGVVTGEPILIVIEIGEKGNLRNYLLSLQQENGDTEVVSAETAQCLLKFSRQVALGMQYLSAKGFVHRDLAARNILVTSDNTCKISDFGMSRDLAEEKYYTSKGGMVPVKWTAPEAINYKKYSTASDVWSYGCLLYEIWSLGHKPFEGINNLEVLRIVDVGQRLSPPPGCPRKIYEVMIICWHPETIARPSFRDIVLTLVDSKEMVLNIPEEDSSTDPLAGVLGAPLEAGENMYYELQRKYIN